MDFDLSLVDRAAITELADALRSVGLNDAFDCPRCESPHAQVIDSACWVCSACRHRGTQYELQDAIKRSPSALSNFFGYPYSGHPIEQAGPHIAAWLSARAQRDRHFREEAFVEDIHQSTGNDVLINDKAHAYKARYGHLALAHVLASMARYGAMPTVLSDLWEELRV